MPVKGLCQQQTVALLARGRADLPGLVALRRSAPVQLFARHSLQLLRRRDPMIDTCLVKKSEKETMRIVFELSDT